MRGVLALEPYLLALILALFWISPNHYQPLLLFIPIFIARIVVYRRLLTFTPLHLILIAWLILCVINYFAAPFSLWSWILTRPLMGVALVGCLVEIARQHGHTDRLIAVTIGFSLLIAALGLGSSQWTSKSDLLKPLIDVLPTLRNFPGAIRGFNVNEIGGAMAWLIPLMGAIAITAWRGRPVGARGWYATIAFVTLALALFIGQSRLAIFGVIGAMGILILLLIPANRWRYLALGVLIVFTVIEVVFFLGVFSPDQDLAGRDEASLSGRFAVWQAAIEVVQDHPWTGVGMNMFRTRAVRAIYPVEGYATQVLPHAHNAWFQIGTDLGLPGVILFTIWQAMLLWMLYQIWRTGDGKARTVAAGLCGAFLAHGVFSLGDAITLWDRFIFLYWWLIGLTAAQYVITVQLARATVSAPIPITGQTQTA
jgi:hypothetical protein